MKNEIETKISAYLRLAELCGTGDEEKKKRYMLEVEKLLQNQSEPTLKEKLLDWVSEFKNFKDYLASDIVCMFASDNNLNLSDEEYHSLKIFVYEVMST